MPSFDRDIAYSDDEFINVVKGGRLPSRAFDRLLNTRNLAANYETMADAFWNRHQELLEQLRKQKHYLDIVQDKSVKKGHEISIAKIQSQIASLKNTRDAASSISAEFANEITAEVVKLVKSRKPLKDFEPELPEQSTAADVKMLAETRANVTAATKQINGLETAFASPADIMQRLQRDLDKFAAAGTPDFASYIHEERKSDGSYAPVGPVHWPKQYVGNDRFVSDGMALVFWLFKDEVRKRIESEITKAAAGRRIIPAAERPVLIKKLESQILTFERVESALVWRLQDKGRSDITHRRDVNFKAFLGIKVGKVLK